MANDNSTLIGTADGRSMSASETQPPRRPCIARPPARATNNVENSHLFVHSRNNSQILRLQHLNSTIETECPDPGARTLIQMAKDNSSAWNLVFMSKNSVAFVLGFASGTRVLAGAVFSVGLLYLASMIILAGTPANAYTRDNHEKSILDGLEICKATHGLAFDQTIVDHMIEGAREPDAFGFSTTQMMIQRVEPNSYGKQRNISLLRIAAQSLHGSPNPTRKIYSDSSADQAALKQVIRLPENRLLKDRLDVEIFSYDTNQGLRNKILINASQFLCVSMAHKDELQGARKFGNFLHMISDTYSASHAQRTDPSTSTGKCRAARIEWYYSMDLVSWKQHRPADIENGDWRFRCLTQVTSELMHLWAAGRKAAEKAAANSQKRKTISREVTKTLTYLCRNVLRQKASLLLMPTGGANKSYSSASGTDNWRFLSGQLPDLAIQPAGLTSAKEAKDFYKSIQTRLKKAGGKAEYSYPSRDMPDLCANLLGGRAIHRSLQCTNQEIEWATMGSERVETMWLPARDLP